MNSFGSFTSVWCTSRNLEEKKAQVLSSIEEQGKITDELRAQIEKAETLVVVEDLYRPYRPKRRTRATIAKEKGLEPLAALILLQKTDVPFLDRLHRLMRSSKEVHSAEEAIAGQEILLRKVFPMRRITEAISVK